MKNAIPDAVLRQHTAVLGKTGSGKTSTTKLAIEQVVAEDFRVCVLDTVKSDWWGITSSASGKQAGLPFRILGGPHGHVPLHSSAGKVIGQLVGSGKLPLSIVDMADFEAGGIQRFFVDFAQSLMRNARGVVYLVIEEAHEVAPKERSGIGMENMAIHWAKKLATAGRSKGIRLIVATQRIQALHNAVLGSCETLIAHRLSAPADQEPVVRWLKANVDKETREKVESSLASLPTGTAWICSGEARIFEHVAFRRIKTYDNTATPTGDGTEITVKTAPVDQDELRAIIGEEVKRAEAEDPKLLRAEVARLQRELTSKSTPVADQAVIEAAEARANQRGFVRGVAEHHRLIAGMFSQLQTRCADIQRGFEDVGAIIGRILDAAQVGVPLPSVGRETRVTPVGNGKSREAGYAPPPKHDGARLARAERLILTALAQYPRGRSKNQVAILTGYAVNGGGFNNAISALRGRRFLDGSGDRLVPTEEGLQGLGSYTPLPTGSALLEHWLGQLGKAEREALRVLADTWPNTLSKEDVATMAGYAPDGGGFNNALSRLRTLELISGRGDIKASDDLFE